VITDLAVALVGAGPPGGEMATKRRIKRMTRRAVSAASVIAALAIAAPGAEASAATPALPALPTAPALGGLPAFGGLPAVGGLLGGLPAFAPSLGFVGPQVAIGPTVIGSVFNGGTTVVVSTEPAQGNTIASP
jgi:hypothetical protein